MAFVSGLLKGAKDRAHTVLSMEGGLSGKSIVAMLGGGLTFLDLNIKIDGVVVDYEDEDVEINGTDVKEFRSLLRVYLSEETVTPDRKYVLRITDATGEFLDLDGRPTGKFVRLHGYINTEVTEEGTPTGELWMWPPQDSPAEVETGEQGN